MKVDWKLVSSLFDQLDTKKYKSRMDRSRPVLVTNGKDVWAAVAYKGVNINGKEYIGWGPHGAEGYDVDNEFDDPTHWTDLPEPSPVED